MSDHSPDCDTQDINPDGIRKPCNCGAPSSLAPVAGSAARNFMTPEQCAQQFEMYAESHPSADSEHSLRFCANFLREFCIPPNDRR